MLRARRILVAPLNWGLGHATRCIPIINGLLENDFEVFIASDGAALKLLQKEFPQLPSFELPSYKIEYAVNGKHFKLKMVWDSPKVLAAISKEKKQAKALVKKHDINGIISDNRLGVYSKKVPCVFLTHQLNVLSGNTTWLSSKMHQRIIKKFKECWVPDVEGRPNLTGKLGHLKKTKLTIKYLGPMSRFNKQDVDICFDLLVLLSGPEPQRSLLEQKIRSELRTYKGRVLLIQGKIEAEQRKEEIVHSELQLHIVNFMQSNELESAINKSRMVLCRSGYTTVMDLAKLQKKAFFIPTPGQYEQVYLAKRLQKNGLVPYCKQNDFSITELERVHHYCGLANVGPSVDIATLFSAFSNVKENSDPTSTSLST